MEQAVTRQLIEGALFSAPGPLSAAKLSAVAEGLNVEEVKSAIDALNAGYAAEGHAFLIEEIAGGYRLLTRKELGAALAAFFARRSKEKLSRAALETLAIIAYKQPATRAAIESIRGVVSDHIIQSLTELGLIKISGQAEAPGRPMLYTTTKKFLDHFGLKNLKDLPREKDFDAMEKA
jgi:segregation and condensation protein B